MLFPSGCGCLPSTIPLETVPAIAPCPIPLAFRMPRAGPPRASLPHLPSGDHGEGSLWAFIPVCVLSPQSSGHPFPLHSNPCRLPTRPLPEPSHTHPAPPVSQLFNPRSQKAQVSLRPAVPAPFQEEPGPSPSQWCQAQQLWGRGTPICSFCQFL